MQIMSVNQVLNEVGLAPPFLRALVPNQENYTALLLQPQGEIEAGPLPPSLADMREGASFSWSHSNPHQNMVSAAGRLATIVYLGEEADASHIDSVSNKLAEYISRSFVTHDEVLAAHQRLHVWYRTDGGEIASYDFSRYVRYDEPRTESPFDITRDT